MHASDASQRIIPVHSLQEFFRDAVESAIRNQNLDISPHASHYVVNLLTLFSRSEALYKDHGDYFGLKPLALILRDSVDAKTEHSRDEALRRLGDVALFVSGVFADSLEEQIVDVDYYIAMGGNAYSTLSKTSGSNQRILTLADVYSELATKFRYLVDVLNEVLDSARGITTHNLSRLLEVWRKSGSPRAEKLLVDGGVQPLITPFQS